LCAHSALSDAVVGRSSLSLDVALKSLRFTNAAPWLNELAPWHWTP